MPLHNCKQLTLQQLPSAKANKVIKTRSFAFFRLMQFGVCLEIIIKWQRQQADLSRVNANSERTVNCGRALKRNARRMGEEEECRYRFTSFMRCPIHEITRNN